MQYKDPRILSSDALDTERLLDRMKSVVVRLDRGGRVKAVNGYAEELLGFGREELVDKPALGMLIPEQDGSGTPLGPEFAALLENPEKYEIAETEVCCKDGTRRYVAWTNTPVRNEAGELEALVCVGNDITKHKTLEDELREATRKANSANEAKSRFLANMSHEIRTPMNGVIGMALLLMDTELSASQRDYVEKLHQSAESLMTIINDILDFSRIEAGKMVIETIDFDFREALATVGDVIGFQARQKDLAFAVEVDAEVPSLLRGDPGRLRQILTNLGGNAVKFTAAGHVHIRASLHSADTEQALIRIEVMDTGIGIAADRLPHLFKPFSQADASTTRKHGGTGLGLAISKQLVELIGGRIGLDSEEGQGSTFWVELPFQKQPLDAAPAGKERTQDASDVLSGTKILIVDDTEVWLRAYKVLLKHWQCRCDTARSGEEALQKLRQAAEQGDPFQAALVDLVMPGMSGDVVGRRVKKDPLIAGTKMILTTSYGTRGDAANARDIGFFAYLAKPFNNEDLRECLKLALTSGAASRQAIVTRHTLADERRRHRRILLAEDNAVSREVAMGLLAKMGYNVDPVATGKQVLEALESRPYDLVLMDVQMPEMDGFEATRVIRDAGSKVLDHDVPIVALTAHAMAGDKKRCLSAGMDGYVSKPVVPRQLAEVVGTWLGRPASAPAPEEAAAAAGDVLDVASALKRLGGDEGLLAKIMPMFMADVARRIAVLRGHAASGDLEGVRSEAHSVKGACANVGAGPMSEAALALEKAAKDGETPALDVLVKDLEHEFERLRPVMESLCGDGS